MNHTKISFVNSNSIGLADKIPFNNIKYLIKLTNSNIDDLKDLLKSIHSCVKIITIDKCKKEGYYDLEFFEKNETIYNLREGLNASSALIGIYIDQLFTQIKYTSLCFSLKCGHMPIYTNNKKNIKFAHPSIIIIDDNFDNMAGKHNLLSTISGYADLNSSRYINIDSENAINNRLMCIKIMKKRKEKSIYGNDTDEEDIKINKYDSSDEISDEDDSDCDSENIKQKKRRRRKKIQSKNSDDDESSNEESDNDDFNDKIKKNNIYKIKNIEGTSESSNDENNTENKNTNTIIQTKASRCYYKRTTNMIASECKYKKGGGGGIITPDNIGEYVIPNLSKLQLNNYLDLDPDNYEHFNSLDDLLGDIHGRYYAAVGNKTSGIIANIDGSCIFKFNISIGYNSIYFILASGKKSIIVLKIMPERNNIVVRLDKIYLHKKSTEPVGDVTIKMIPFMRLNVYFNNTRSEWDISIHIFSKFW